LTFVVAGYKPVRIKLTQLVGNHMVGIRCSTEMWASLTNHLSQLKVEIKHAQEMPATVYAIEPGRKGTACDQVTDCHYLFAVSAFKSILVEIVFPNIAVKSPAEIIVCKTPEQTELPY
jgi:hypothetical protein